MYLSAQKSPRARGPKSGTAAIAFSVITALVAGGLLVGAGTPVVAADGSVSGRVYRDFNSNGSFDSGHAPASGFANDKGIAGVVATATDGHGKIWSATTKADGSYSIPVIDASGTAVRVEFTEVPEEYEPASRGGNNGTSVQFVSLGANGVDYGVNAPDDYSQGNPPVVTAIQYAGLSSSSSLASTPAIVAQPWGTNFDTGTQAQPSDTYPGRVVLATVPQVGSTWGSTFQASTGSLFASAAYKRHAGLGPLGLGGIYRVGGVVDADGNLATSGSAVQNWLDVTTLGVDVGTVPADATPAAQGGRGLSAPDETSADVDAFERAGKVGIGAIAVSTDQKSLYFVNLFDKKLYQLDISNVNAPTLVGSVDFGLGAGERPWALTVHQDSVFIGYVDSGEQLPAGSDAAALELHVLQAPESNLSGWTPVLDASLGYVKGNPLLDASVPVAQQPPILRWNAWVDQWSGTWGSVGRTGWNSPVQAYPQPVLTDLDFDTDGYLTLSLDDRTSLQGGNRDVGTDAGDANLYQTVASGDLLIAAPTATGYAIENNGEVGDRPASATANNNEGPGGGEYYNDRQDLGTGPTHRENTLGSIATLAGVDSVVAATYDPLTDVRVTGLNWFQPSTGAVLRGYQQIRDAGASANPGTSGTFQKGGGLANVQALAQLAPVEIGNRVWFDADQDGIQDADEPALDGVTVDLVNQNGEVIGTTTTADGGQYYFSTTDPTLEAAGFIPGSGSYTVRFTKPATGNAFTNDPRFGTVNWSEVKFTAPNQGDDDTVDSDAIPSADASSASISIETIGAPGENNHTFDAGLVADGTLALLKKISADGGTAPEGATYTVDLAATDFRGDTIDLGDNSSIVVDPTDPVGKTVTLPVGSSATVTEGPDVTVKSYSVSPTGAVKVTGTRTAPTLITVTNTLFADGFFEVTKSVTGPAAGSVSPQQDFTLSYSYPGLAEPKTLVVAPGGTATSDAIPYGTEVTITEATPTGAPANVVWGTPIWTVGEGSSTPGTSTTLTIGDGSTVAVGLENPTTQTQSGFTVTKSVTGDAAESVPADFEYTVDYSYGTTTGSLTLSKQNPSDGLDDLPFGTVVTLSERAPGEAAPDVSWGSPIFSGDGVTVGSDGTATFTIGLQSIAVALENPTTRLVGGIQITKTVTGDAEGSVPQDFDFTVRYATPTDSGDLVVSKASPVADLTGLPAGTVVTLSEAPRTGAPVDVAWGTPVFSGPGVRDNGDGTATVTIVAGSAVNVGLENPTTQLVNGFSVTKLVTGDAASSVPDDFSYTVNYTTPGQTAKALTLTKADSVKSVTGLPLGSVVTLSEVAPGSAAPDVKWGTPVFSGTGVTTNPDGTASFTVGEDAVQVELTNPTERLFGSFSITKQVTGPAADTLTPGFSFTGTYLPEGQTEPLPFSLTNGSTFTSPALPAGTVVTLTENAPKGGLPELSGWVAPIFLVDGQPIGTDGPVTITIGADSTLAVTLENPTTVTPKVTIVKGDVVDGVFHDADTMPEAEFYTPGETRQISITATNTGTDRLREVVLHDDTLSGADIQSLVWSFPDGGTATAGIVNGELTARWDATFGTGTAEWMPGATITGVATLTVAGSDAGAHVDRAIVDATGAATGTPVTDRNDYNAYTAAIQVIKYDGSLADPAVKDEDGNWIVPSKPLVDPAQDANDTAHAVVYEAGKTKHVRWVVTNTGNTWLTEITLSDATLTGPSVTDWTSDLSAFGGSSSYSFVKDGTWRGMLPPGASFFSDGTLTLGVDASHADDVTVGGTPIVPEVDENGVPTGKPQLGDDGRPVLSLNDDGTPRTLTDHDPFHAITHPAIPASALPNTGLELWTSLRAGLLALLATVAGLGVVLLVRRRRAEA